MTSHERLFKSSRHIPKQQSFKNSCVPSSKFTSFKLSTQIRHRATNRLGRLVISMPFPLQSMILLKFHLYCLRLKFNLGIRDSFSLIDIHIMLRKAHFRKAEYLKPRSYLYLFLFKICAACAELRPNYVLISPKMLHKANTYTHPQMTA